MLLLNREFIQLALAEPNTRYQELQWSEIAYFIMNGTTQENRKLMLKSLNSLVQGLGRVFKGMGNRYVEALVSQVFSWRTLDLGHL